MPTIETLTRHTEPVSPDTPGSVIFARFQQEPDTLGIAVVKDGRPIGLVERDAFLLKFAAPLGHAQYADRPVTAAMDTEPAVVEAGVRIDTFSATLLTGGPAALMRSFIVTRDGIYQGVGTAVSLLQANNGRQRAQIGTLTEEVRTLKDSTVQGLASARTLSQFMSVLNRELRTPMNGVLAVAELLRRLPLPLAARSHVTTIVESSDTLLQVLQDAVDVARAEAGELELSLEPTPLRALMDGIQDDWAPRAAEDHITLMASYEGDTELGALIDAPRLRQVLDNLISNALKFTRNGVVETSLKAIAQGDRVRLEARVRDDGPGIDPTLVDSLFEPFVHGSGLNGAGLGLTISNRIVSAMGGSLTAENNAGRGATFAFQLDVQRTEIETGTDSNVTGLSNFAFERTPHILIVDDNATNRVVAQALCEMFGCTSETVEDGLEALQAVQERAFDLVLMDIKMPRMDGVQATCAIRALTGPAADIPIVALTANADPDDAKTYLSIGMCDVVEKPIKPERLRRAINGALNAETGATDDVLAADRSVA
ncbi:MAG: signal transduction histidine kinase/ActR/RegA family two-component response regulator [Brevundimonas sp.]|jgi:signal transduction histidine kinase/ActR/RegA family two-component response regulator|uniref:response regulator n=1 Tax=Brevundimonas sp. TaxID=1871086 RepID=UPI00248A268C|nr:response regulator [Brevundimonas sp.]MDI1281936.1 response regulator [Brevundimonas sp.]